MKTKMLFFAIIISITQLMAVEKTSNYQIVGQVTDSGTGKPIPYSTITIVNDSTKLITKQCADGDGKFQIATKVNQKYTLIFSSVGYQEANIKTDANAPITNIGDIKLKDGVTLKEVGVVAQKPLIKVDADKITYSTEADPDAKTSTALEMMRKVPMLSVDAEDNVLLKGQKNYKVLVNGKSSSLMDKNFKEVIKSMPANSIKEIVVITNPSFKYDAEGVGGIINIITNKKIANGYNGSVSGGFDSFGGTNESILLSSKINKFGFSVNGMGSQIQNPTTTHLSNRENYLSDINHYTDVNGSYKSNTTFRNYNGEASYEIDSLNLVTMKINGYAGNEKFDKNSNNEIFKLNKQINSRFGLDINGSYGFASFSGNIDYQKTFKKPEKTFTVSYKLDNNPFNMNFNNSSKDTINYPLFNQLTKMQQFTREQTVQIDYCDPLTENHQIECGTKGIYRQNNSNSELSSLDQTTNKFIKDSINSNQLTYNQYIACAYAGYGFKMKQFNLKSGARAEMTWNEAVIKSNTVTGFTNTQKNIIPYVTFSYQLNPSNNIKLSYTQRLNRPTIWYLNPYNLNIDRLDISYGNPKLKAEIAHSVELAYNFFTSVFMLGVNASGSFTNNSIEEFSKTDSSNIRLTTYDNIGRKSVVGVNTYMSYRPSPKLNLGFNGGLYYTDMQAFNGLATISNHGATYDASLNTRVELWENAAMTVNGGIYSPQIFLQGQTSLFSSHSIGLTQQLLNKKLSMSLSIKNPFMKELRFSTDYKTSDFKMNDTWIIPVRSIRFNISYNFGETLNAVKKTNRGIQNDDLKAKPEGGK